MKRISEPWKTPFQQAQIAEVKSPMRSRSCKANRKCSLHNNSNENYCIAQQFSKTPQELRQFLHLVGAFLKSFIHVGSEEYQQPSVIDYEFWF